MLYRQPWVLRSLLIDMKRGVLFHHYLLVAVQKSSAFVYFLYIWAMHTVFNQIFSYKKKAFCFPTTLTKCTGFRDAKVGKWSSPEFIFVTSLLIVYIKLRK